MGIMGKILEKLGLDSSSSMTDKTPGEFPLELIS